MCYAIKYAGKDFSFLENNENIKGQEKSDKFKILLINLPLLNMSSQTIVVVKPVLKNSVMKLPCV